MNKHNPKSALFLQLPPCHVLAAQIMAPKSWHGQLLLQLPQLFQQVSIHAVLPSLGLQQAARLAALATCCLLVALMVHQGDSCGRADKAAAARRMGGSPGHCCQ